MLDCQADLAAAARNRWRVPAVQPEELGPAMDPFADCVARSLLSNAVSLNRGHLTEPAPEAHFRRPLQASAIDEKALRATASCVDLHGLPFCTDF